ncbi:MAG: ABC transporter ATP-binding protein [Acidobacteria bacterium]|jgi:lipoprotein-releasing system ATP-binding protein|nr:ABC transporter ATP-binding protein [Acidobacteriota bacterium]
MSAPPPSSTPPLLAARGIVKGYRTAAGVVSVLQGVDLEVAEGEMVAITGASGVGKSTLLHVLGTLDRPDAGSLWVAGEDVLALSEPRRCDFRNRTLGFVFQFHHLLPEFSALENVAMPLLLARRGRDEAHGAARVLLEQLGLGERADHRPGTLSGGEQQRVAVARALAMSPRAVLADEPTGNLDQATGQKLHELLRRLAGERRLSVVVVTHNEQLARGCDRVLHLEGGRLAAV